MKKNNNLQVLALWRQYQAVKFGIDASNFSPNSGFYIITPCNPRSRLLSEEANSLRVQKILGYIERQAIPYISFDCGDPEFTRHERSFALSLPWHRATNLARLYQQNAIYHIASGQQLWLLPILLRQFSPVHMGPLSNFCC